jgi:predicted TPR repeat methyltransferase
MDPEKRVQWVYAAKNNQELAERYDDWAESYEVNLYGASDYTAPEKTLTYFTKYVSPEAHILDAGAGTGLVGVLLHAQDYHNLVALDLSAGMLAEARQKNVYGALKQGVLGEALDFPTNAFDAVVSVGVFTLGHAPVTAFAELIRLTKPGGYIIFSLNVALYDAFEKTLLAWEQANHWKLVEIGEKFYPMPISEPDVALQVLVYRVMASR